MVSFKLFLVLGEVQSSQLTRLLLLLLPDFEAIDLTGDDDDNFQDADLAEGDVEEEVWNADADGDINAEMEEDELEEE